MSVLGFLSYEILRIYSFLVIVYVLINILISFNIINSNNRFINMIVDSMYLLIEPLLRKIRSVLPNFGSIDISPVILLILIRTVQYAILKYSL